MRNSFILAIPKWHVTSKYKWQTKLFIVVGKENSQLWGKCHVSVISLSFLYSIYALKKPPSFILTLAVGCYYASLNEKASGFRNSRNFCSSNPKSRKCLVLDSGIVCTVLKFGKQLNESGFHLTIVIRNPSCPDKVWNQESGTTWNPELKIVLDSLTRGEFSMLVDFLFCQLLQTICG